jgi:hypothetical protein
MDTIELVKKILELLELSEVDVDRKLAALQAASVILRAQGIVLG